MYLRTHLSAWSWSIRPQLPEPAAVSDPLASLESLLRRLPRVIRQLRSRHGNRPPFLVSDERDLEDLLRALLHLLRGLLRGLRRLLLRFSSLFRRFLLLALSAVGGYSRMSRNLLRLPMGHVH